MFYDASQRLGGRYSGVPGLVTQVGDDPGEEVKELLGMGLLDIGELLRGSRAN
jgi:hypothetical protein